MPTDNHPPRPNLKSRALVLVEEIERPLCDWCAFDHKRRLATHTVKVTLYHEWEGRVVHWDACKRHAQEIAEEMKRQTTTD